MPNKAPKVGVDSVRRSRSTTVVIGLACLIAVGAVVALVVAQPWKTSDQTDSTDAQFQTVTVSGNVLPPEYSDQAETNLNVAVGAQAPSISGESFDGTAVNIAGDGKPKVVVFVAHWDDHSQRELSVLSQWLRSNKSHYPDVNFYVVATGSDPSKPNFPPSSWISGQRWPGFVMADDNNSSAAKAFGIEKYPYMVVLDGNNKVILRTSGELSTDDFSTKLVQPAENSAQK